MNNLDKFYEESLNQNSPTAAYAQSYCRYLSGILLGLDYSKIGEFVDLLLATRKSGKNIYFIGNGGSAATASHFANDLQIGPTRYTTKSFKAISLADNSAILTCIANDFGYDEVFKRQLEIILTPGDLVVAISASGNSPNILRAVEYCKSQGNKVVGVSGFDGGQLQILSDLNININTPKDEYGPVEDLHMVLDHLVSTYLIRHIQTES